jgi:hypothetical protein
VEIHWGDKIDRIVFPPAESRDKNISRGCGFIRNTEGKNIIKWNEY